MNEYYRAMADNYEKQGVLVHDFKKHLYTIEALCVKQEYEKISSYINNLVTKDYINDKFIFCQNDILNVILTRYSQLLKSEMIDFNVDIRANTLNEIADEDLTAIFCNILDNAMEAARLCENAYVDLSVKNKAQSKMTVISIVNTCKDNPIDKNGVLLKQKKNTPGIHGMGMVSVKNTIKKYCGDMQMYYEKTDKTFHLMIIFGCS